MHYFKEYKVYSNFNIISIIKLLIMKNFKNVLGICFILSVFLFTVVSCTSDEFTQSSDEIEIESRRSDRPFDVVDDDGPTAADWGYKLVMRTGEWGYTGQDLPTGHQVWDCMNEKTRSWVFETFSECHCQVQLWDDQNPGDEICIYYESCTYGNYVINNSCSW